jgi:hypothetical protein
MTLIIELIDFIIKITFNDKYKPHSSLKKKIPKLLDLR